MSYLDALNYLAQKTSVIELYDQWGGRLAVCPEWNGRVLTSTCDGLDGESFGCVNVRAIETGRYENFGGEDQWTISPLIHSFTVESLKETKAVLQRTLPMNDANGTRIEFGLSRTISLLSRKKIRTWFGDTVADAIAQENVSVVGFYTENTVRTQEKGWVASRQRGAFNASPYTYIIVSTVPPEGEFRAEPSPVKIDLLGSAPHRRIRHLSQALLLRADGQGRCQATVPFSQAPPILGAIELRAGTLTLWMFDLPGGSDEDMIRLYNSDRAHISELDGDTFYETNCFSAVQKLHPEDSFTYGQCTLHINADNETLDHLVRHLFNVSLDEISQKMLR